MTVEQMVAQIKKAREAFVEYMETTYKDKWDPWGEFEMYKTAGFLDGACERMLWLDNIYTNKKIKKS